MERLQPGQSYCFHCQACGTRLLTDRVFKRVLPLPNGNWNTLVDDWCCHPDPFANNSKLLPRADDCLLGDTYVLVSGESGCEDTMTQELSMDDGTHSQESKKPCRRRTLVSCKSCSAGLGEAVTPGTLKLYITEVLVETSVGDSRAEALLNRADFLEKSIAARLLELSLAQSTFRFSIQTPEEKAFLLLWVLNSDSIVASLPGNAVRGDDPGEQRPSSPGRSARHASPALKVLYLACSDTGLEQRDVIASWEVNAFAHPLDLPVASCGELLQVLVASTASLPLSLRCMNSFQVAYMRL